MNGKEQEKITIRTCIVIDKTHKRANHCKTQHSLLRGLCKTKKLHAYLYTFQWRQVYTKINMSNGSPLLY